MSTRTLALLQGFEPTFLGKWLQKFLDQTEGQTGVWVPITALRREAKDLHGEGHWCYSADELEWKVRAEHALMATDTDHRSSFLCPQRLALANNDRRWK
jgi:hypothetical protein